MASTITTSRLLERYIQVVREVGIQTNKNAHFGANVIIDGTLTASGQGLEGAQTIQATSANALAVGPSGTTNPILNVDTSGGVTDVTGLNINGNAAASGLNLTTLSSGTNENLTLDAKGSGTVTINGTATGIVVLPAGTTIGGSVPLTSTITSSSANALAVGQNGTTNPAFNVDASTATSVTGLNVKSAASGAGLALSVISSASAENLTINAKSTGTISIGTVSTGSITVGGVAITSSGLITGSRFVGTTANANAFAVGRQGTTNPVLNINSVTSNQVTGINITGAASGGGVAITTTSSSSNEVLTIAALGTGTITFNPAVVATANGATNDGIQFGSLSVGLYTGTGNPTFSAMNGSIYVDSNATTTTTRIYINKSGAGTAGTTWTNLTAAA